MGVESDLESTLLKHFSKAREILLIDKQVKTSKFCMILKDIQSVYFLNKSLMGVTRCKSCGLPCELLPHVKRNEVKKSHLTVADPGDPPYFSTIMRP